MTESAEEWHLPVSSVSMLVASAKDAVKRFSLSLGGILRIPDKWHRAVVYPLIVELAETEGVYLG